MRLLREHRKDEQVEDVMRGELTMLNLSSCHFGDNGAGIVAAFLKTVREVCLSYCSIGLRGFKAVAKALKHNRTVEYLDFADNQIRSNSGRTLIDALACNVCIVDIALFSIKLAPKSRMTVKYLTQTRNALLVPAAVRRASLYLIAIRCTTNYDGMGTIGIVPKEVLKMIAMKVWATRRDPIWIHALTESERTGKSGN